MKIKENQPLSQYTTFRMGGNAKIMYFPESVDELKFLIAEKKGILAYVIGGGSNLLINDKRDFNEVLCLREFNTKIENRGNGIYYLGASVRIQKVIKIINKEGFGGIEYLFSVPGLIGGAIYMNAGRGKKHNKCISDYILSVEVYKDGTVTTVNKEECSFDYRTSVFQSMKDCIIIGGLFKFPEMPMEESAAHIQERTEFCKNNQDMSAPNFGTVFSESNKYIMSVVRAIHIGYKNGCAYSTKTKNWMLHGQEGTFEQAMALLNKVNILHKIFGQKCNTEVKIWE